MSDTPSPDWIVRSAIFRKRPMPWGYSFGRLNIEAARELVRAAQRGQYFYPGTPRCGL